MFGMKLEDLMKDDAPIVAPSTPAASPQQFWEAKPPAKSRRGLYAAMAIVCVVIGGLAIAGTQMDRPRTEPTAPAAKAEQAPAVAAIAAEKLTPAAPPVAPVAPKVEVQAPAPKEVATATKVEENAAPIPIPPAKPIVAPAPPKETDAEFEKRIRDKVIADRAKRHAEADKDDIITPAKDGQHELIWVAGAKAKAPAVLLDELKEFRHKEIDQDADNIGPRIKFVGADGLQYFIRPPFTDATAKKIKAKFGMVSHKSKFPQTDLPLNYRNRNLPDGGGCCVWAAVSTLAYYHGYNFRLEDNRRGGSTPFHAVRVLKAKGIPAVWTDMSRRKNAQYLRDACDAGLGATVGVCLGYQGPMPMLHEINLAGINDTHAAILDNNDRQLKVRTVPIDKFLSMWDGSSVVIFPKGKEDALAKYGRANLYGQVNPNRPRDLSDEGAAPPAGPRGPQGPAGPSDDIGQFDPTGSFVLPPPGLSYGPWVLEPGNGANCLPSRADFLRSESERLRHQKNATEFYRAAGYTDDEIKVKLTQYYLHRQ